MGHLHEKIKKTHNALVNDHLLLHQRYSHFNRYNRKRDMVMIKHQVAELAKRVRTVKENAIPQMLKLFRIARDAFEERGAIVHFAHSAQDACQIACQIIGEVSHVVQSSTDMIGEIGLNRALEQKGIPLIHSTATFRLVQRATLAFPLFDRPNPIEHLTSDQAKQLNSTLFPHSDPSSDLLANIREEVKGLILTSPIGITGANAVAAHDGVITLAYSQGNTTLVANRPTHLAIIGLEKLVPHYTDAAEATYLQGLLEAGANGARFNLHIGGPSRLPEIYGPREKGYTTENLHLLFVDNYRTKIAVSPNKELLNCIRCFACIHHCPAYTLLGPGLGPDLKSPGFGYQGYVGGRELALTGLTLGLEKAVMGGLFACTLCGACKNVCPLDIDTPQLIQRLREKIRK